ncbi:class I SAM-dependent methyltransferase [Corynebacterium halotolerans]|uniref:class I SAM-dependent methyltransferase n=1 Tax=Corynebacterium halotolerans TaxID=225326 RepID=UPI003CF66AE2
MTTSETAVSVSRANREFWDGDAERYHADHRTYLDGFHWCPEMLSEGEARLLGDVRDATVLELGCGSAPCARWLSGDGVGYVSAFDLSAGMLRRAGTGHDVGLVQADAMALPYRGSVFDVAFSAFGAIPFVRDIDALFRDVARVLAPGGRFVYSVNHPMRWIFVDDPASFAVFTSYFEEGYLEYDDAGAPTYAEFQHKLGDHVRALVGAGFTLDDVLEPEWPEDLTETWGQWSPERGRIFPGTAIFSAHLPA